MILELDKYEEEVIASSSQKGENYEYKTYPKRAL